MRPIKYRAFYKGEMRQVTALEWIHEGEDLAGCYLTGIDKCVVVNDDETTFGVDLLAFTGLHDRNGTEIYESDIITDKTNQKGGGYFVVSYLEGTFIAENNTAFSTFPDDYCKDNFEVVGSVFENPGLLKGE